MGKEWGNLIFGVKNIITYSISPYEQRAFAGIFKDGIPNLFRRFKESVGFILPGMSLAGLTYYFGNKRYAQLSRKNPADYENDE